MKDETIESPFVLSGCNWELTLKCTLNCMHCGSRAGSARADELSIEECYRVADELVALGCRDLTMIGGEVFLFRGWDDLCAYLTDNGVAVNIISNGYIIGERELEQIRRSKLVNIGLSIDGMADSHNRIRGRADAFARMEASIGRLNKANVPLCAITSLMKFNYDDLEPLYTFLSERNFTVWQLQLVSAMGNMEGRHDFFITPRQVQELTEFIRDKNRSGLMQVIAADSIGYYDENEVWIRGQSSIISCWNGCQAGITSVFIDSTGNVKGCGALYSDEFIEGNVRTSGLREIWNREDSFSYNRKFTNELLSGNCRGCDVGDVCKAGCRSSNYFSTGSLYANAFCCHHVCAE
jgi:radical SAM protein with 4Fe4S-binding SPASM domain